VLAIAVVLGAGGDLCASAGAATGTPPADAAAGAATAPALTLLSQSPFVTTSQPWFELGLGVSSSAGAPGSLRVNVTFYGRLDDFSQLQQAISGTPPTSVLTRLTGLPVTNGPGGPAASACVTVLPDAAAQAPPGEPATCATSGNVVTLGCRALTGTCGDVYPVVVTLTRQGSSAAVSHFTTFLTYQEPSGPVGEGGALRVGVVVPVTTGAIDTLATPLVAHRDVPTTLAVSPAAVTALAASRSHAGTHALEQLAGLTSAEQLDQPFVPINVAALSEAGLANEIGAQVGRGDEVLHAAGLKPSGGPWVDTTSSFSQGDQANLASGLQVAGASQLVLSDQDLAPGGLSNITFAQPFSLDLGHGSSIDAVAADSTLSNSFTAQPDDPVLGAEQLLASLSFVHFEDAYLSNHRGVVVVPPAGWRPSGTFLDVLLGGLTANPALLPETISQLFADVPIGGGPNDREPSVRHLQNGAASRGITRTAAQRIALDRQQLSSFADAVSGHPAEITTLSDALLATEARSLSAPGRAAALNAYARAFGATTGQVTLATERTVTFTAQRAAIPVTVLSAAPYPVHVVVTLASDKFSFPDGNTRELTLNRPTTSVRVTAQARTSGDRLPIDVTLHTPDGQLLIAHTVLTVQSTAISFVGVALTVLAGAVLVVWWIRTWRRSRRRRPRAQTQDG
jgi:Family of unknown function (DUF6049)